MASLGLAPETCWTIFPFFITTKVGILIIPNSLASSCCSSTLIFPTLISARSFAISSLFRDDITILHCLSFLPYRLPVYCKFWCRISKSTWLSRNTHHRGGWKNDTITLSKVSSTLELSPFGARIELLHWCPLRNFGARYLRLSILSVLTSTGKKKKQQWTFTIIAAKNARSQGESNPQLVLRRRLLYPFNYGNKCRIFGLFQPFRSRRPTLWTQSLSWWIISFLSLLIFQISLP